MKVIVKNKSFNIDTWLDDKLMDLGVYDKRSFINLTEACIEDLNNYDNMQEGLRLLEDSNKIGLLVDCDPDGYTSASEIYIYCDRIKKHIDNIFFHTGKQHGLEDTYKDILNADIDLLIVPDAGSNDFSYHKILKENNINTLVLDHHECDEGYSPYACVINNQLSNNVRNKNLSGAGVTYKFIEYCDTNKYHVGCSDLIDLVALGNISDMMDISEDETRYYCLKGLNNINNRLFKAMANKFISGNINMLSVAWSVTPKINAIIRNGTVEDKMLLFEGLVNPTKKIETVKRGKKSKINMSTYIVEICDKIKREQDNKVKDGVKLFTSSGKININDKCIIIQVENEIDNNITGLVANKLLGEYSRPIIILQHRHDDIYGGSVRSPRVFGECSSFRDYLQSSEIVELAQGHANACGIEILESNIHKLKNKIENDFRNVVCEDSIIVDYEIDAIYLDNNTIKNISQYKYLWGQGLEEPKFLIKNVEIDSDSIQMMCNKTILSFGYYGTFYNKKFCSRAFREDLGYESEKSVKTKCDIVGTFEAEEYKGNTYYKVIIDKIIKK